MFVCVLLFICLFVSVLYVFAYPFCVMLVCVAGFSVCLFACLFVCLLARLCVCLLACLLACLLKCVPVLVLGCLFCLLFLCCLFCFCPLFLCFFVCAWLTGRDEEMEGKRKEEGRRVCLTGCLVCLVGWLFVKVRR